MFLWASSAVAPFEGKKQHSNLLTPVAGDSLGGVGARSPPQWCLTPQWGRVWQHGYCAGGQEQVLLVHGQGQIRVHRLQWRRPGVSFLLRVRLFRVSVGASCLFRVSVLSPVPAPGAAGQVALEALVALVYEDWD